MLICFFFCLQLKRRRQSVRGSWLWTVWRSWTVRPSGPSCPTTRTLSPPWTLRLPPRSSWCGKRREESRSFSLCLLSPCGMPGCLRYLHDAIIMHFVKEYRCVTYWNSTRPAVLRRSLGKPKRKFSVFHSKKKSLFSLFYMWLLFCCGLGMQNDCNEGTVDWGNYCFSLVKPLLCPHLSSTEQKYVAA